MKTKLHFNSAFLGHFFNFKNSVYLLFVLFLSMSTFGQSSSSQINFNCFGNIISFSGFPDGSSEGYPSWSNGTLNTDGSTGWTLAVEDVNGELQWSVRSADDDVPNGSGIRYFYSVLNPAEEPCGQTWIDDFSGCTPVVECLGDLDFDNDGSNVFFDCNDNDPLVYPGAPEICDGIDNNCDGQVDEGLTNCGNDPDNDGDGFAASVDCDDNEPLAFPGNPEVLYDGIDNDCDPLTLDTEDADNDGVNSDADCDDSNNTVYPGAPELCDDIDNDCDGQVDEGLTFTTYYADTDGDGFGDPSSSISTCDGAPSGFVSNNTDCDDADAAVNPDADEIPFDTIDNDCDPSTLDDDNPTDAIYYCNEKRTKILICHKGKNKCVQENALDAHLGHGDTLGSCDGDPYEGELYTKSTKGKTESSISSIIGFSTRIWPNPSENNFNIKISTDDNLNGVDVQVIDVTGKQVHSAFINWNENYKFGSKLESGVYFVKIIQGENVQVKKVIKR